MKKLLALAKWAISKTPDAALGVLAALKIPKWKASLDGVEFDGFTIEYKAIDTLVNLVRYRELVAEVHCWIGGQERVFQATTRFKNDDTDKIAIDGVAQKFADFDFDLTGLTDPEVRIELRYIDLEGIAHELLLSNKAIRLI